MFKRIAGLFIALATLSFTGMVAGAADYYGPSSPPQDPASEKRVYFSHNSEPRIPTCEDSSVKNAVKRQIAAAIPLYYDDRRIDDMLKIRQSGYWVGRPSPLARRYCHAQAILSDGSHQTLYYQVTEHSGFLGLSWGVDACLQGLDRWRVFDGNCRRVRPQY